MPIYEYRPLAGDCDQCRGRFELWEKIADAPASACPTCGQPCERVLSAPNLVTGKAHLLTEKHYSERGFTQYRKVETGKYEKVAGPGPDKIDK